MSRTAFARSLFLLLLVAARAQSQSPAANQRIISGIVISDAIHQPLEGAAVSLADTNGFKPVAETRTDADGRFSFTNLPDGKFALSASHRGYSSAGYQEHDGSFTAIVTGENQTTTGLTLSLPPLGAVYGTVTEDSGDPVPQARISLYRQVRQWGRETIERANQATADEMGHFEISPLAPGVYFLCVSGEPWYRQRNRPSMLADNQSTGNPGRSALDVAYALTCYPNTTDPAAAEPIRVDPGGRIEANFTLHPVPALRMSFQIPNYDPRRGFPGPQLRQKVFGFSDFAPVTQSFIQPQLHDGNPGPATVEISGIPPGQYDVEYPGQDISQNSGHAASIQLSSGDLTLDASSLRPTATVSGKLVVVGQGQLPSGGNIALVSAQGEIGSSSPLGADGSFQMRDVAPGEYGIQIAANGVNFAVTQLRINGVKTDDLMLKVGSESINLSVMAARPLGAIDGFVTRDGKPASGVFVLMVDPRLSSSRFGWFPNQSDSDGSFTFPDLLPGQYTIVAIQKGWTLDWRQPSVIAPYLANGVQATVSATSRKITLKAPLEAQEITVPPAQTP